MNHGRESKLTKQHKERWKRDSLRKLYYILRQIHTIDFGYPYSYNHNLEKHKKKEVKIYKRNKDENNTFFYDKIQRGSNH